MQNVIVFKEFQDDFLSVLKKTKSRRILIANEIRAVENFINSMQSGYKSSSLRSRRNHNNDTARVFKLKVSSLNSKLFIQAYSSYLKTGDSEVIKSSLLNNAINENNKRVIYQANEFLKYYNWLVDLSSNKVSSKTEYKLTHKQKMLALKYLGLETENYDNTSLARVISQVLELDYDNTRKNLSYLSYGENEVRTKKNLEAVLKLFDASCFEGISMQIKEDIEKLK